MFDDSKEVVAGEGRGSLRGRAGIVTGAGSGIGRATAQALVDAGAHVVVADIDEAGGRETVEMIGGPEVAEFVRVDVVDPASVHGMVTATLERFGRLDFAHNNAGIELGAHELAEIPFEDWSRVIGVNLTGTWNCMREEIPHMLAAGGGAIVNTSSGLGLVAMPRKAAYTASKHGVIGLTRAAALEYSSRGIRVNAVCPGAIETPLHVASVGRDPESLAAIQRAHPIGRAGRPGEVADAVVWLVGDTATFVTGIALPVDGGYVAQ